MRDSSPDRNDRARPTDKQYEDHARDQSPYPLPPPFLLGCHPTSLPCRCPPPPSCHLPF
jgi:hypothetical protein